MPVFTTPSHADLEEFNWCHNPHGSGGGQFCSSDTAALGLRSRPEGSKDIPDYLRQDVLNAIRAGIHVMHQQQPEPIRDIRGELHDPLAMSHAQSGSQTWRDRQGRTHTSLTGRIRIMTRGGEFVPETEIWGEYGPRGRKKKELTPDSPFEKATPEDVVSTFRHEIGHLMDEHFYGNKSGSVSGTMAREVRAWVHAVEMSPNHEVSERMLRQGLLSHGYYEFRKEILKKDPLFKRVASWDLDERLDRVIKNETELDPAAVQKAHAFAERTIAALKRYGAVLRKKGIIRVPEVPRGRQPSFGWHMRQQVQRGPGRSAFL